MSNNKTSLKFENIEKIIISSGKQNQKPNKMLILDYLIDFIGKLVAEGKLKSGDELPGERKFAKSFKISRSSVREALKILGFLGVLEIKQGSRTLLKRDVSNLLVNPIKFINLFHNIDVIELYKDRIIIEVELVKLATKNATEDAIKKMEVLLDEAKKSLNNPQEFLFKEFEFHNAIFKASGNKTLTSMMLSINNLLIEAREKILVLFEDLQIALNYHIQIMEAIKNRDADKAGKMMLIHLEDAIKRLENRYGKNGNRK
jgi:GntR family transcriptional regulator, transcriptional repressor for pyruvate dehydrogenase complex